MRFLVEASPEATFAEILESSQAAQQAGLDGVMLIPTPTQPAPLVTAAAIAGAVPDILIAAEVPLGERHPLEVAEEASVVDQCSAGRLVLVVRPAPAAEADFAEAVSLLQTAFASRPFRFEGTRWRVPANLPENVHNIEHRTRLMPPPLQPRLELWASGVPVRFAIAHALGHVADGSTAGEQLRDEWHGAQDLPWGVTLPRVRRDRWDTCGQLLARLKEGRATFGQDWCVLRAPASALFDVGRALAPRIQLDGLPAGLDEHWSAPAPCH